MRNPLFLLAAAALMAPASAFAQASDDAIIAASLPDTQFKGFLLRTVIGTDTFKRSFVALGAEQGCATFRPAFDAAFEKHAPAWRTNLVQAWRDNIPAELLEKAAEAGPGEAGRMVAPHGAEIGADMEKASKPVLTEATAEILATLAESAKSVDMASVDQAARVAELEAIDARNFCGVLGDVPLPPAPPNDGSQPGPEQGR